MSQRMASQLSDPLFSLLNQGCPALLLTIGADGFPNTAYTWAVALDTTTIRFGADHGSTTLANLRVRTPGFVAGDWPRKSRFLNQRGNLSNQVAD